MRRGELPPIAIDCPKLEQCSAAGEPPCPRTKRDLNEYVPRKPLIVAEDLCIKALELYTPPNARDSFKNLCREAEDALERALALPAHEQELKLECLPHIAKTLEEIDHHPAIHERGRQAYHARARSLEAFLPAFGDRLRDEEISEESARIVHANVCNLLRDFDSTYIRTTPRPTRDTVKHIGHIRTELETMALLTRLGPGPYFPYPATEKEEASHARSEHNHDLYCIKKGKKYPIQVKTSKQGSGYTGVIKIVHYDMESAIKQLQPPIERRTYSMPQITDLLLREQRTGGLDGESRNTLNLLSMYVISRIDSHTDFRRD